MHIASATQDLLNYNEKHKILICQECKYAIQKSALKSHLLRHKIYRGERQRLLSSIAHFEIEEPDDVPLPMSGSPPVAGLPVISGYRCTAVHCTSLWASEKRMRRHWSESHGVSEPHGCFAVEVKLQTFFRGTKLRYFEVTLPEVRTGITSATLDKVRVQSTGVDAMACRTPPCEVDLETLGYFHHFINTTSLTLPFQGQEFASYWQKDVVGVALQSLWLLNGLLAISATHFAALSEADMTKQMHLGRSAQFFHNFSVGWEEKTRDSCVDAVEQAKIGAQIICIQSCSQNLLSQSPPFQWQSFIATIQGWSDPDFALQLAKSNDDISEETFFLTTNNSGNTSNTGGITKCPPALLQHLNTLPYRMAEVLPKPDSAQDFLATLSAIEVLVDCFSIGYASDDLVALWKGMLLWLDRISDHFKSLLWHGNYAALVVLAHWGLLVEQVERKCWLLRDAAGMLRAQILGELPADVGALVENLKIKNAEEI